MKKAGIAAAVFLALVLLICLICTVRIDSTPYFKSTYFRKSFERADSIDKITFPETDSLYAGFARVSITPWLNNDVDKAIEGKFKEVPLAGYGARNGEPSTGVHDSVFVKAIALKAGISRVVFVGADLLIMPPNITDSVAVILAKKGIRREQLFFSATHSHSSLGGWGSGYVGEKFAGKENKNLEKWLVIQIVKAVNQAVSDLQPAEVGSGSFNAACYIRNRLIGDEGTKNDEFSFIFVEQVNGKEAVIGSFSAHATTLGDKNMEISADYPGYWERKAEKTTVDLALFCAGAVGSQSPAGEGNGFEKSKSIGEALADSLLVHIRDVKLNRMPVFSAVSLKMSLPDYHVRITTKINLATFLSRKLMPLPQNVYLQAARIGDMIWITTPSDFSGEYALQIKNGLAVKGFMSNITSFNGNYVGYIIPGRYFYMNEYESKVMGWFGPNMGEYTVDLIGRIVKIVTKQKNS
jgi:Neutral/alkaline non-lysosomal ceramidase, N-terminal